MYACIIEFVKYAVHKNVPKLYSPSLVDPATVSASTDLTKVYDY